VDVANVMGSRPDGWWRDRAGAAVRLYGELAALAASGRAILPGETGPGEASLGDAGPGRAGLGDAGLAEAGTGDSAGPPDAADPPDFVMVLEGAARAAAARITSAEAARGQSAQAARGPQRETARGPQSETARGPQDAPTGPGQAPPGRVRVVEARGSGDDAIVDLVRELPGRRVVVTADRALRDRCAAAGATVLGPAWLLAQLRP